MPLFPRFQARLRRRDRLEELDDRLLADIGLPRRNQHLKAQSYMLGALSSRTG